jgi:hypothetical protein
MTFVPDVRVWFATDDDSASAQAGERETGPGAARMADFPLWNRCPEMLPYSAFIRAIIFLFAAFSLRFRRSLGFSKC